MTRYTCLLFALLFSGLSFAQNGLNLDVTLDNYDSDTLFLGYYYGDKTYLADTAYADAKGHFTFQADTLAAPGVYLLVLYPSNNYTEILLPQKDQQFSVKTDVDDMVGAMSFGGSRDNEVFYDYMNYLGSLRPKAQTIQQQMASADPQTQAKLQEELAAIDEDVRAYQKKIIANHDGALVAAIIAANMNLEMPEFEGTEEEKQYQRFYYTRDHYFDYIDLTDSRLLRTPFLFNRVETYVDKLTIQVPDSVIQSVDYLLQEMKPSKDLFRYYLIHFLNKYAGSKVVGMDAVYVHLAQNYYGKGMATWTDEEQLAKILDNAEKIAPLLIGKKAPNIRMQKRDGTPVELYDINSEYTVLYFWRYDCGHCKKSTPYMKEFYEQFKDQDITLMAACLKFTDEVEGCWEYVDENDLNGWLHTVDPYGRSQFHKKYDLRTTPQIYVLNRDKEIVMKKIGAEQLPDVMNKLMERDRKEQTGASGQ